MKTLKLQHPPWSGNQALENLFSIFQKHRAKLYIVGGAVRDAAARLNNASTDYDLTTDLPPNRVQKILEETNIKVIPTGLKHGTVTAVVNNTPFQITTFRKDVKADGRYAEVEYTYDIAEDASRRDFTVNALYADMVGKVFDPLKQGLKDLKTKTLRFIGEPAKRIREDYLRILRFFRFLGTCDFTPCEDSMKACAHHQRGLSKLSKERVLQELLKMLMGRNVVDALGLMHKHKAWPAVLPAINPKILTVLQDTKGLQYFEAIERLYAITALNNEAANELKKWPVSKQQKKKIEMLEKVHQEQKCSYANLYYYGNDNYLKIRFLSFALGYCEEVHYPADKLFAEAQAIKSWQQPVFPLQPLHLIESGVKQGKEIGEKLKATEEWWIKEGFMPTLAACLSYALKNKR